MPFMVKVGVKSVPVIDWAIFTELFEKVAKQVFIVTVTGLWPVTVTNLGSRGFIPWPPEASF